MTQPTNPKRDLPASPLAGAIILGVVMTVLGVVGLASGLLTLGGILAGGGSVITVGGLGYVALKDAQAAARKTEPTGV